MPLFHDWCGHRMSITWLEITSPQLAWHSMASRLMKKLWRLEDLEAQEMKCIEDEEKVE